jgi:SSS family solute:Na+ symporter
MTLISFLAFTILVAAISYYYTSNDTNKTSDDYFLGGRSLTAGVIAGSLLLTNLSTEQLIGLNGSAFTEGILVMCWETLAAIAMVVTALFLLPRYLKGGLTTVPQFLESRYDTMTKTIASALFLSGYVVVLLPIVLYSGALAFVSMFDIPEQLGISHTAAIWLCVWGIGIIGSIYAVFGGLKAVAISDSINAIGLLIGGLLIPILGLLHIGDGSIVQGIDNLYEFDPSKFNAIGDSSASVPFATIFTGMMLVQLFYWGTNQAIIQRALAAKDLREGQKGLLLAAGVKILGPLILVLPGMIAFYLFKGQLDTPDQAYPELVKAVLPAPLVGFFAAVIFGAIMSSFNSALNSSVTLFGLDIYKEHINKDADDETVIKYGKRFGLLLAFLAMFIAPFIAKAPKGLFGYLQEINGCYSIPILTIIVVGYLTKRTPAIAAKVAITLGAVLYAISQFALKPYFIYKAKLPLLNELTNGFMAKLQEVSSFSSLSAEQSGLLKESLNLNNYSNDQLHNLGKILQIDTSQLDSIIGGAYPHFLHVMAILFVMNVIIMLVIGHFKPRSADFELKYSNEVDITPYAYAKQVSLAILIIVISSYVYFS